MNDDVAFERAWSRRAGFAAIVGAILGLAGFFLLRSAISGDTNFQGLEGAHDKASTVWLAGLSGGLGYLLLTGPLYLLFRAVRARSDRVRGQLIGLVILGPVLLGIAGFALS